ncbi:MAG: UDP-3-O-acyl-N-acetylglucosamine deacetylase [Fimbriimonas sp.]
MTYSRKTLARPVVLEGLGLHSGEPVTVTLHPSDGGIWFRRDAHRVEARPENVTDTSRCTRLGEISTIEHFMSAFAALEITDLEVELSNAELPGLDGSSAPLLGLLLDAGLVSVGEFELAALFTRVFLQEDALKIAIARGQGHWRYDFNIEGRWPGEQSFELHNVIADYATEVAPARTFATAEELPKIIEMGLGRGLDESSCLILGIDGYKNDARFADEPARHKLLDLIGDLYLSGVPLRALSVVAQRSGHRTNVQAAYQLRQAILAS